MAASRWQTQASPVPNASKISTLAGWLMARSKEDIDSDIIFRKPNIF
jgi:hypothetical protein